MRYNNNLNRIVLSTMLCLGVALPSFAVSFDFYGSDTAAGIALGFQDELFYNEDGTLAGGSGNLRRKELITTADINLLPNVVYAINGAPAGNNQTVDVGGTSVFFENIVDSLNVDNTLADVAAGSFYNRDTGDAGLNAVINSQAFNGTAPSVTLNNLVVGQNYRVQVIGAGDTRNFDELNPTPKRFHDVGSGNPDGSSDGGAVSFIDRMGDSNGDGTWNALTGIADFTADDTTQTLVFATDPLVAATAFSGIIVSSDAPAGTVAGLPGLTIDRGTGAITLSNSHPTGSFEFTDLTLTSAAGSINAGSNSGAVLAPGSSVTLAQTWEQSPFEDVLFELTLAGEPARAFTVQYAGDAIQSGDLNGDGAVDVDDWTQFKNGSNTDISAASEVVAYRAGDLDGDFDQDLVDFRSFQLAFDSANGAGAFAAIQSVPEPSAIALAVMCLVGVTASRRRLSRHVTTVVAATAVIALLAISPTTASAASVDWGAGVDFSGDFDVINTGDTILAINGGGADVTLNGVSFTGVPGGTSAGGYTVGDFYTKFGNSNGPGTFDPNGTPTGASLYDALSDDYKGFVSSAIWPGDPDTVQPYNTDSVTFSNLSVGQDYLIQLWTYDGRNGRSGFHIDLDGDASNPIFLNTDMDGNAADGIGQFVTGTFTADMTTQSFGIEGFLGTDASNQGRAQINAIQLRTFVEPTPPLDLIVNTVTGETTIANNDGSAEVGFDSYEIRSAGSSLDEANWSSIASGAGAALEFPQGDGSGNGWEESPNADASALIEWHLLSDGGGSGPDGDADFEPDGDVDGSDFLEWQRNVGFFIPDTNLQPFGDANGDNAIDEADLVVWEGQYAGEPAGPVTPPLGPGESISLGSAYNQGVDAQDLVFTYLDLTTGQIVEGNVTYVSSIASVPEPTSLAMVSLVVFGLVAGQRKGRSTLS